MNELESTFLHRRAVARQPFLLAVTTALVLAASSTVAMGHGHAVGVVGAWGKAVAPQAETGPLRIQVEPSIDDANLLPGWIRDRHTDVTKKVPAIEGHEQWIAVEIDGATYDYRVSVVAMRDGAPLGAKKEPEVCECNTEQLFELVDARIAAASEDLRAAVPPPEKGSESRPVEPEPAAGPEPTAEPRLGKGVSDDRSRPLGMMGYVGLGVGVLGAGMLAAGIPLALRPDEIRGEPGTLSSYSTQPPGIGLAVGGGVALAGGVALIVVDVVRRRKASVAVLPAFGPRYAGVFVTRKF